jgi:hypothetical protein
MLVAAWALRDLECTKPPEPTDRGRASRHLGLIPLTTAERPRRPATLANPVPLADGHRLHGPVTGKCIYRHVTVSSMSRCRH